MRKHKCYTLLLTLMCVLNLFAQHDNKAKEILDQVATTYKMSTGMRIDFKGTQIGTLWVKGEKFVLECGGIKSWFDGETQWSYVAENEEVNVSSPTPEEIQAINPYALVTMHRKGFDYRYKGSKLRNGKLGNEIVLIPENKQDISMFILSVSEENLPFYIGVDMTNGHYEEFVVTQFVEKSFSDDFFRFDPKQYPNAELIDLR